MKITNLLRVVEKTRTGASLIRGWLFDFVSGLYYDWVISYLVIWRYTSCWQNTLLIQTRKHYACATHFSLPADRFHTETGDRFAFTWYCCEILYRSENSRPSTRTGVNSRRGDSLRHDILWWYHVNKYRATWGNRSELAPGRKSPRCHVNTP